MNIQRRTLNFQHLPRWVQEAAEIETAVREIAQTLGIEFPVWRLIENQLKSTWNSAQS